MTKKKENWGALIRTIKQFESDPTKIRLEKLNWLDDSQWAKSSYNILLCIIRNHFLFRHLISLFASKSPKPALNALLLIGISQLYENREYPDRLPKIVHHTVDLVNAECSRGEGKFANAVLRRISESMKSELNKLESESCLSIRYSTPDWLVQRWIKIFGEESTKELLKWNQNKPNTYVHDFTRFFLEQENRSLPDKLGLKPTKWDDFYLFEKDTNLSISDLLEYPLYIQDPATSLAPTMLNEYLEGNILDACAAPGGKSLILRKLMGARKGQIHAVDLNSKRLQIIEENQKRLNLDDLKLINHDWLTGPCPSLPKDFNAALVDAPCTSSGIIGKHPEIRYRLKPDDFDEIPNIQLKILQSVAEHIKIGGKLLYSTCSIDPTENSQVGKRFLQTDIGKNFDWLTANLCLPHYEKHDGAGIILFSRLK